MRSRIDALLTLAFCLLFLGSKAQVDPPEGAVLNHTQVMLEAEPVAGAVEYVFKYGVWNKDVHVMRGKGPAVRVDDLEFGTSYIWQCEAFGPTGERLRKQGAYRFRTADCPVCDTSSTRYEITRYEPGAVDEGLIFLDYSRAAIDRSGRVVWFLAADPAFGDARARLRDLKLSSRGTLTFIPTGKGLETDLEGRILWQAPDSILSDNDTSGIYHHELLALPNGNNLALARYSVERNLKRGDVLIPYVKYPAIFEIDPGGKLVWSWTGERYFTKAVIEQAPEVAFSGATFGHANSVYVDESRDLLFVSLRDLNQVIAIRRSDGEVVWAMGDPLPAGPPTQGAGLFRRQHAAVLSPGGGELLLFNNDQMKQEGGTGVSTVQMFNLPFSGQDSLRLLWEFGCDFDSLRLSFAARMGNALVQPNGNILVNTGTACRTFEVTRDKRVVWDCLPSIRMRPNEPFRPRRNYRSFYAPHLYPNRHVLTARFLPAASGGGLEWTLGIHNMGFENDRYEFVIYGIHKGKKKVLLKGTSPVVAEGESAVIEFRQTPRMAKFDDLVLETRSLNHAAFTRSISFLVSF